MAVYVHASADAVIVIFTIIAACVIHNIQKAEKRDRDRLAEAEGQRVASRRTTWRERFWLEPSQARENEHRLESYLEHWARKANSRMEPQMSWEIDKTGRVIKTHVSSIPQDDIRTADHGLREVLEGLHIQTSGRVDIAMTATATSTIAPYPTNLEDALRIAFQERPTNQNEIQVEIESYVPVDVANEIQVEIENF